jgi:membrane-associated phospholipid phosphatase
MDAFQQLEILWILFIQGIGEWLSEPMQLLSLLGQEDFYMLVMPILYWSLDATLGLRVAMMLLLSNGVNTIFKTAFHTPRPYWVDPQVKIYSVETSFGMPSGHAQHAASIWGLIAASLRGTWVRVALILLILFIGLSRLYLGVHFFRDVLLGWFIGWLTVWVFLKVEHRVSGYLRSRSLPQLLTLALGTSLLLGSAMLLSNITMRGWQVPEKWKQNALQARLENEIDPLNMDGIFTVSGTWLGLMAGAAWLYKRQGGFDVSGTPVQRLLRYAIGLAGVFIFWHLLGTVFPRNADVLSFGLRYARYTLVGLWISALAPLLFERLGLAYTQSTKKVPPLSSGENPL